jgi:HNH endonuclease
MAEQDGDERPIRQIRAEIFSLLLRRPGMTWPGVTANLNVSVALDALEGGSSRPGEVNGFAITPARLRDLLARIGALGLHAPDGGSLNFAITDPDGRMLTILDLGELRRLATKGRPAHPAGDSGCPVAGPPPPTDAYTPTAKQQTFVKVRDRRCRFPNCGQRVGWADLDHVIPHARGGPTACENLCCLCRSHHRLKTFARGWRFVMDPDGTLHVTTPSGVTRTTRPPGLRPRAPGSPPAQAPPADPPPF